jgi:hypothetical protein
VTRLTRVRAEATCRNAMPERPTSDEPGEPPPPDPGEIAENVRRLVDELRDDLARGRAGDVLREEREGTAKLYADLGLPTPPGRPDRAK